MLFGALFENEDAVRMLLTLADHPDVEGAMMHLKANKAKLNVKRRL